MWKVTPESDYALKANKWPKKYRREFAAMHSNLDTFYKALVAGAKLEHLKYGFIHPEPQGILAIDQKGGGIGLKEARLYIYPDKDTKTIHLITIGDKNSQSNDIKFAKEFVIDLIDKKSEEAKNGQ